MVLNKKGMTAIMLIVFIFTGLALMMILGISTWCFSIVDDSFSGIDFDMGNTSFGETYNQTLKQGLDPMTTSVPVTISMGVLLGMIMVMVFVSYGVKDLGRLWIVLDIAFIIVAEIVASAISDGFTTFINTTPELFEIYSTTLSTGSSFVINLPLIIPVMGMLVMLVTYLVIGKKEEVVEF